MHRAEHEVARQGLHTVEIGVEPANHRARALYERLGYRPLHKERESFTYATPEGERVDATVENWILRKPAPRGPVSREAAS